METTIIKALSWRQPFANLMLQGKIETRTWSTKIRGQVLICSSLKPYSADEVVNISGDKQYSRICEEVGLITASDCGVAIAVGELIDCRPMRPEDENRTFVEYKSGLFCHIYANVRPIKPFPWKGCQGWKTLDEDTKKLIQYL